MGGTQTADFFVSYTSADRAWAEWIAWQLKQAGSSVVMQAWDMVAGGDFVHEMQKATTTAKRTIAVLSPAYFSSHFGEAEWRVAFASDPDGEKRRLVPVRVADFTPEGLLATRIYIDLVGKDRHAARTALLDGIKGQAATLPTEEPRFPGEPPAALEAFEPRQAEPRFPSALPRIWNVPHLRNPTFTGRDDVLEELADRRRLGSATAITQAIAGLGGVGKTSLAVEYAFRQRAQLDVVWWVRAEEPATLLGDFTGLASALELPEAAQPDPAVVVRGVHRWLASHDRWLLVFDNANRPEDLELLLPPAGGGQVLVTSRWSAWDEWAAPLRLQVLSRQEAVSFLCRRAGTQNERAAAALADALGDLPLALAEAAAYLDETQITLDEYLELVRGRAVELFGLAQPAGAQRRVATVWSLSLERVRDEAPGAEALLELCAFLAPDAIPRGLPAEHAKLLPEVLAGIVGDPLRYNEAVRVLGRYSLVIATPHTLGLHRLVQAVVRVHLGEAERSWAEITVRILNAGFPSRPGQVTTWPACQRLLPHVLAATEHAERLIVARREVVWLLGRSAWYLWARGQYREARPLAEQALAIGQAIDPDHPDMAHWHSILGFVLRAVGDLDGARTHHEHALRISEATMGPEHRAVAAMHNNLGLVLRRLGDLDGARIHHERALAIGKATMGPSNPDVAAMHNNLGLVLRHLGDLDGARIQHERALQIGEATIGPDHPDMAGRHSNLGAVLAKLGDLAGARIQHERALQIGEATIGPDHPDMVRRHSNLGAVLAKLGDLAGARVQYERALAIDEAVLGAEHLTVADNRHRLDWIIQQLQGQ